MRSVRVIGLILLVLVLGGIPASSASASMPDLTFYANGEVVPSGVMYSNEVEIVTTGPLGISIPESGLSISCPADPYLSGTGWLEDNGVPMDTIALNGGYTGPVRECAGHELGGLLIRGAIRLKANGSLTLGRDMPQRSRPELAFEGCYFLGSLKANVTLPGAISFTLSGTMTSKDPHAGCPRSVAHVEVGPFELRYGSYPVEGRISR